MVRDMNGKTINQRLDELFWGKDGKPGWIDRYPDERKKFVRDGLVYKFHPRWAIPEEAPTLAGTEADKYVDQLWNNAPIRVAFILKDKHGEGEEDGDDVRQWHILSNPNGEKNRKLSTPLMKCLADFLYGLVVEQVGFAQLRDEAVKFIWNTVPFAYVEAKKIAGGPDVSDKDMKDALSRDIDLLIEEIDILNPNILVCFGPKELQFNYITQMYDKLDGTNKICIEKKYELSPHFQCSLWYYPNLNKVVIQSYHPSYYVKHEWIKYEKIISPFRQLLNNPQVKLK